MEAVLLKISGNFQGRNTVFSSEILPSHLCLIPGYDPFEAVKKNLPAVFESFGGFSHNLPDFLFKLTKGLSLRLNELKTYPVH